MTKEKHLTDEALMLLTGDRLSSKNKCLVNQHLEECKSCRKRHESLKLVHSVFERLSDVGLYEVLQPSKHGDAKIDVNQYPFPWHPVAGIVLGCMLVLALFFYHKSVPEANASELLANSIQRESQSGGSSSFHLQVGRITCASDKSSEEFVSFRQSVTCQRALLRMKESAWGHGNPLSARTFRAWHDSLRVRHDKVIKKSALWQIQTTTNTGAIRAAILQMRATDYHPTALTLQFENEEKLTISEDIQPVSCWPTADVAKTAAPNIKHELKYNDEPEDLLEVEAWEVLHGLKADDGWEANVVRNGPEIVVKATVDGDDRKREFQKAFQEYPGIKLDTNLASELKRPENYMRQRTFVADDGPPLAAEWLVEHFPDDTSRMAYTNNTLRLSQQLLGRAFVVDELEEQQAALTHCSCAKDVSDFLRIEKGIISAKQTELALTLEPLIGPLSQPPSRPLSIKQAKELDLAIQEVVGQARSQGGPSLDSRISDIHRLLSK